jgi:large subunit ribosomal protein L20
MPRVRKGHAVHKAHKRVLKAVKGCYGPRHKHYRLAKEALTRAQVNARVGRKQRKRLMRGIWVVRLNAACRENGIRNSQFIKGCKKAGIAVNRKILSQIAIEDPATFQSLVAAAKAAL